MAQQDPTANQIKSPDILVVDDNLSILQLLTSMLKPAGFSIRTALNGAMALQEAWQQPPDLILLDINLPGMDGYEVCKCLKANTVLQNIPILFITGINDDQGLVKALQCGGVDYITKPFNFEDVQARIRVNLDLPQQKKLLLSEEKKRSNELINNAKRGLRILVAEDNPVNQEVVRMFLASRQHEITIVPDGKQAVNAATTREFDVILMDIQMPIMDGLAATAAIRAAQSVTGSYTPIVALTAYSDKQRALNAGMDRFITKPFTRSNLLDTIEALVKDRKK
jgi:CheY-like chemotaxis protein